MTGVERIKEQMEGQKDPALIQTVEYLLSLDYLDKAFLNEEKSVKQMAEFIKEKGRKHLQNGWNYVSDSVVYSWGAMYFSLPNKYLKLKEESNSSDKAKKETKTKNNVVSMEKAKKALEEKKEVEQLTLFGGAA